MDRREFMTLMGVGGLAASLPVALAACKSETTETPAPSDEAPPEAATDPGSATDAGSNVVGTVADLEANGFLLNKDAAVGPVMVVGSIASLTAVNPTCPHAGCTVDWSGDESLMICACHNSQFNPDGSLKQGPATEGLPAYSVEVDGDNIVVS